MKIQKSQQDGAPLLVLVPTPIGNLEDMSPRAIATLQQVDCILCEDTRVTKMLLSHFHINAPLISYHVFNEDKRTEEVIALLKQKQTIALVSDAGMPLISDPGFLLVREAIEAGYRVISLPGPNAALTALIASGLPTEKFMFYGFLSSKPNKRSQEIIALRDFPYTIIFHEAPHRIEDTLEELVRQLGDREAVIARELTKTYEEYTRGTLSELKELTYKGEIILMIRGASKPHLVQSLNEASLLDHYEYYLSQGLTDKEAMKQVANDRKLAKSEVYKAIHQDKEHVN